ncbi:MAG: hypothetical protein M1825_004707 [Sarcosagium campestre]|nr:MAG: hypothetical protein M1825_004707 [Sarcosagium campestre]
MKSSSRNMRRMALQRIATLSASGPLSESFENSDLERLCATCQPSPPVSTGTIDEAPSISQIPMSLKEFETLLALCKAAPLLQSSHKAERLLDHLCPYLSEAHLQAIAPSPFLRDVEPCPWEALTSNLTSAVLAIGLNHPALRHNVIDAITAFIENCLHTTQSVGSLLREDRQSGKERTHRPLDIMANCVAISGFMTSAASFASFWTSEERYRLIEDMREILSEPLMVSFETAISTIHNSHTSRFTKDWRQYISRYSAQGRPLSAMYLQHGFMRLLVSFSSLLAAGPAGADESDVLEHLVVRSRSMKMSKPILSEPEDATVALLAEVVAAEMGLLEDGADFLQMSSEWLKKLAFNVKASAMTTFTLCVFLNRDVASGESLKEWLEDTMADPVQMAEERLALAVLRCMAVLANLSLSFASNLSKLLPRFIVQGGHHDRIIAIAARSLANVLEALSQDAVITTLYTLGNVLSSSTRGERSNGALATALNGSSKAHGALSPDQQQINGSSISLALSGDEEASLVHGNVVQTIVGIARTCHDDKITALAQSMLLQKIGKVSGSVDARIVTEAALLVEIGSPLDFKSLLRYYARLSHEAVLTNQPLVLQAVLRARNALSSSIRKDSPLYDVYLTHLLETIVSVGDIGEGGGPGSRIRSTFDVDIAAREIAQMLQPLALLVSANDFAEDARADVLAALCRDTWFNVIVHGFTPSSSLGKAYRDELKVLASQFRPLISAQRTDQLTNDVGLNTVLRRGMTAQHTAEQKRLLIALIPSRESDIKSLSYSKVIFLRAAYLMESLRADSGGCAKVLLYFMDPTMNIGDMGGCMMAICESVMSIYLRKALEGNLPGFSAPHVAKQLSHIFAACCHRIPKVQSMAASCAERIVIECPSALCQKSSLFALLELLTIMWSSCLEAETDEYEWKSTFSSSRGNVSVELSDDYSLRRNTLRVLYGKARSWVIRVMSTAPLDIKGFLQTYLSDYDDEGAYGHLALGRSFALEMGSSIPLTDQRLGAIDHHGDVNINTASDFIAQYTTRQEYRYADTLTDHDQEWVKFMRQEETLRSTDGNGRQDPEDAERILDQLHMRILGRRFVSIAEVRDVLRRAAALLCRSKTDQSIIIHHLVSIPFAIFTKQSIKLGISLWLGVIHENPRMESRILFEIAQNWEGTVRRRVGIFSKQFHHVDPFFLKEEFAPSDRETLLKRQQVALNLIGPHFRLLYLLSSHFNATRLGSVHVQRCFHRMIQITLDGLKSSTSHPLAREVHFQVILLALTILRNATALDEVSQWRLLDQTLTAALSWFNSPPRWSFGGNRVQVKAETHLLADVEKALERVSDVFDGPPESSDRLTAKRALLNVLLANEQTRLIVWLFPLDHQTKHHFTSPHSARLPPNDAVLSNALETAWLESPAMAIHMVERFQSPRLHSRVRQLLLARPEQAIGEADALQILLGSELPLDVSSQLQYLLYWAPANPITAVTYFLPAYGNHPFVLQYAMRALESHPVDVTFFYVPQIVQTLRYDALGYVKRFILETAKVSQLFAHQIIWNMKANAYKDEDSTVPDPLKPTLDDVTASLTSSFSDADRSFYEKEFSFFNEVTDISGKLRPFLKSSKAEKKQKIEEELRKIRVEKGVYLPSNPDGVVIGIDRKSGKPLQSHAKAPFMATFRIKKSSREAEGPDGMLEQPEERTAIAGDIDAASYESGAVEVWQSAIFKVGDDCRQDVLALQMIAAFRGIFNDVGLDVFVYPYRVTATAPGCGVIDVLPNSISRDMLGREAVNGLYDYFVFKYGGEDSIRFQLARNNFVKSMAAYSVISYLLQFKDRHNGNIMVDDAGHILHIDFGFCFDIAPGGIRFERAPFKLTSEMVAVMGGSTESQPYRWFEELCVKAFLAARPHAHRLVHLVVVMLDSGLPCFKPETIQHFRERFVLERTESDAADFMRDLIRKSYNSYSTKGYDQFQLFTNGIPY